MDRAFEGKVAVVTGAGGGLGRCHAIELAARGAKVVVNDLGGTVDGRGAGDAAARVVAEIREAGGTAIANNASVADKQGAKSIIDSAVEAFGTVDILVNNAGILRDKSFKKMDMEDFDLVVKVHLLGTAYVTHAAWPIMLDRGYGRIVLTSSGSGLFGNFGQSNYGAAKMGMVGLMNVLSKEAGAKNIRVNCLSPRAATRMTGTVPGRASETLVAPKERDPALVTPAVLWMCSDEAPENKIIRAGHGSFACVSIVVNEGVDLGTNASFETLMAKREQVLDMSRAKERPLRMPLIEPT